MKQIYAKRKETIEHVITDAEEIHGMRWTTLGGLYASDRTFVAMNFKKMETWTCNLLEWEPN